MTESELRDEICRVGESLFNRGYVHATAGNISNACQSQRVVDISSLQQMHV